MPASTEAERSTMSYDELKAALTNGTGIVELDEGQPQGFANSLVAARKAAYEQQERITHGERVAYLYTKEYDAECARGGMPRAAAIEMAVTMQQAQELVSLGAKWIGAEVYRP